MTKVVVLGITPGIVLSHTSREGKYCKKKPRICPMKFYKSDWDIPLLVRQSGTYKKVKNVTLVGYQCGECTAISYDTTVLGYSNVEYVRVTDDIRNRSYPLGCLGSLYFAVLADEIEKETEPPIVSSRKPGEEYWYDKM